MIVRKSNELGSIESLAQNSLRLNTERPEKIREYPTVRFNGSFDYRTRIRVPKWYLQGIIPSPRNELTALRGIIFPYTPSIRLEYSADFSSINPAHSNYPIYFYKHSKVSEIRISGKFTVQNLKEAGILISTIHLLRSLTKMSTGNDSLPGIIGGAPPPICLLTSHGEFMFNQIPVVISSYSHSFPDDVNYFDVSGKTAQYDNFYGINAGYVPTLSTIELTLNYVLSSTDISSYTQPDYLSSEINNARISGGFL